MSKIEELKLKYKADTSEKLFLVSVPPDYQCGAIDNVVKDVKESLSIASNWRGYVDEEVRDDLFDIEHQLWSTENELEELRKNIEQLRDWGTEWKEFAKTLIEENDINIEEYI